MTTFGAALLKQKMQEFGYEVSDLAKLMGIDKSTLYRKMAHNGESFTIKEANQIVEILDLTKEEAMLIFFAKLVA